MGIRNPQQREHAMKLTTQNLCWTPFVLAAISVVVIATGCTAVRTGGMAMSLEAGVTERLPAGTMSMDGSAHGRYWGGGKAHARIDLAPRCDCRASLAKRKDVERRDA